ncbi:protein phosphatase 1 regulatory subunit 3B-B isoform X2 [Ischnura elegans]|uniref:protein phosphatase 1 regulatory subunit 3B-B isoform X2 n=1 Tax=Ischnura elegans TaxID=197161 RepID=UPI001ED88ED2|nr:protein phosphatase 1 regulatory subunit 3B-B isoform X2 [Ischnura elegans]
MSSTLDGGARRVNLFLTAQLRWPMVSLAMPAEYDSVVAASPPVFSHSPPTPGGGPGGFLANYGHFRGLAVDPWQNHYNNNNINSNNNNSSRHYNPWAPTPRYQQQTTQQQQRRVPPPPSLPLNIPMSQKPSPRRPCLVVRPEDATSPDSSSPEEPTSPTRLKKRVVFADDRGLSLTQVRVMREPSDCPPLWTLEFLAQVTRGVAAAAAAASSDSNNWELNFQQPAADYLAFRRRLDTACVSLENAVVVSGSSSEDSSAALVGTVKVRNLAFQKEVSLRSTFDAWATHTDTECSFVPSSPPHAPPALYDTFSFSLRLPATAKKVQFCVRFTCESTEYWDNNDGENYTVARPPPKLPDTEAASAVAAAASLAAASSLARHAQRKFDDAVHAKVSSWSEFASWNHLVNDAPYW